MKEMEKLEKVHKMHKMQKMVDTAGDISHISIEGRTERVAWRAGVCFKRRHAESLVSEEDVPDETQPGASKSVTTLIIPSQVEPSSGLVCSCLVRLLGGLLADDEQ